MDEGRCKETVYTLIIVDDEKEIRKGLCELVNWEQLGFKLLSSFEDGIDAMEFLRRQPVDVVLTDIRMSEVSGIELAEFISKQNSPTTVAIISGYKEFEYAKKAMEYNVRHYLLKPTKVSDIRSTFAEIKSGLDKKNKEENALRKERDRHREVLSALEEQFFMDIVMGALRDPGELKKRLEILDPELDPYNSPCWVIHSIIRDYEEYLGKTWKYGRESFDTALRNFFRGYPDASFYILMPEASEFKLVHIAGTPALSSPEVHLGRLKSSIREILGIKIDFSVENCFKSLYELANYTKPLKLEQSEYKYQEEAFLISPDSNSARMTIEKLKMMVSNICEEKPEQVGSLMESLMESMDEMPFQFMQHYIINLFTLLSDRLESLGINIRSADCTKVLEMENREQVKLYCQKTLLRITRQINERGNNSSITHLVEKAKDFIAANYHKDISLERVADTVFLNPVYLSRMFKQITGYNFVDYLTELRMQKSIELLEKGNCKIHEISERVGYNSNRYFNMVFKKYTGYTPKEYCRKVLEERG